MKKFFIVIVLFQLVNQKSFAQDQANAIKQRALKMATAFSNFKLDEYITYLHPSLINAQGGSSKIKQSQDSINKYQKMFGVKISKVLIGEVSKIETYKKQLQATFPMTTTIVTPMGEMNTKTTVVALSDDAGKTWFFIDGMFYNAKQLNSKLPKLSSKIIVPPTEKPQLTKPKN
jgi:3-deoxy-D-manno-octulosonic-acid transferase